MNLLVVTLLHWSLTDQICTLEGCLRHCILAHGTSVGMSSSPALVPRDLLAVWPGDGPAVQYSTVQYSTVQYSTVQYSIVQ